MKLKKAKVLKNIEKKISSNIEVGDFVKHKLSKERFIIIKIKNNKEGKKYLGRDLLYKEIFFYPEEIEKEVI